MSNRKKMLLNALFMVLLLAIVLYFSVILVLNCAPIVGDFDPSVSGSLLDYIGFVVSGILTGIGVILACVSFIWIFVVLAGDAEMLLLKKIKAGSIILTVDKKTVLDFISNDTFLWIWEYKSKYSKKTICSSPPIFRINSFSMIAHPITENPKVMNLSYNIEWDFSEGAMSDKKKLTQFFIDELKFCPDDWQKTFIKIPENIVSELYDFNKEQSKQLANFHNPITQQNEFKELVIKRLEPVLKDTPFVIKDVKFSLN